MSVLVFNERSWAIDLISEINQYCLVSTSTVKRATGESGLRGATSTLFPDVILHGEGGILQGWELKLPETNLHDTLLLNNAAEKADLLGTNSFLVWNGREAALWARTDEEKTFREIKTWIRAQLVDRKQVEKQRQVWVEMLSEILSDLEFYLQTGVINKKSADDLLDEEFASKIVESLYSSDARALSEAALKDETLRSQIGEWVVDNDIDPAEKYAELAKLNILSWINRFVFCHYLSRYNPIASRVEKLTSEMTISEVKTVFDEISSVMDFSNVFVSGIGDEIISNVGWSGRLAFNELLTRTGVTKLPEGAMRNVLDEFAFASKRKSQGQFATPKKLAMAVATIAMDDLTGPVADPCCGSGTIAKSMYEIKVREGMARDAALETVWASDKYQMPLQLTSMNLSDPNAIMSLVQVFKSNVFELKPGMSVELTDPKAPGAKVQKALPRFKAITSNLPFVRQEVLDGRGPAKVYLDLESLKGFKGASKVYGKADLYAAILLDLDRLLDQKGRIVVLVSNSWLGTKWGARLQDDLRQIYNFKAVIKSGNGRWFNNADVVSTALVLEKRSESVHEQGINFVTTLRRLEDWDDVYVNSIKVAALQGKASVDVSVNTVPSSTLDQRRGKGFYWRVNFFNSDFLDEFLLKAVPISKYFDIARGARTGQDDFYYPDSETIKTIELEYLVPLLKSSKECRSLSVAPSNYAFTCNKTLEELEHLGHLGALSWIRKFENRVNGVGEKLSTVLEKQHSPWYFLSPNETGDFALSLNPFQSLAIYRTKQPVFMNQRLVRLTSKYGDKDLLHALLNSCFGMLAMEFLGFGRGEGVLDLRNESVKEDMNMLDPGILNETQANKIKLAFAPLLNRPTMALFDELESVDRVKFEQEVLRSFGLEKYSEQLFELVKEGMSDRLSSTQRN